MSKFQLTIYSPAPPTTRLHALNVEFGALLRENGIPNEVVAVPLPDAINHICDLHPVERPFQLPIVTNIDLVPAINATGPKWHAYDRANRDLRLLAGLYDVAFGVTVFDRSIRSPADLAGTRIATPARPSSVRLFSEALLHDGWGLKGKVELVACTPPDLMDMVRDGKVQATTWNITTVEGRKTTPALPWVTEYGTARWLRVGQKAANRINAAHPFDVSLINVAHAPLLSFRQGLAIWDETPCDLAEQILGILLGAKASPFWSDPAVMADWPGLAPGRIHPALRGLMRA